VTPAAAIVRSFGFALLVVCNAPLFSQVDDDEKTAPVPRWWGPFAYSHFEVAAGHSALRPNDSPVGYLTDRAKSNGAFAEFLVSIYDRPAKPSPLFIMGRFSYNDWGNQQIVGLVNKVESSRAKLITATIGLCVSTIPYSHRFGAFFSLEYGADRWDVSSSHPALSNMRFVGMSQRIAAGFQSYGLFIEWGMATHILGQGGRRFTSKLGEDEIDKSEYWDPSSGRHLMNYHWMKDAGTWDFCMGYRYKF